MLKAIPIGIFAVLAATPSFAETAAEAAQKIAKKRGYSAAETKCYVDTFPAFASQNAKGKWRGPRGKAANAYKATLASCGVSR